MELKEFAMLVKKYRELITRYNKYYNADVLKEANRIGTLIDKEITEIFKDKSEQKTLL